MTPELRYFREEAVVTRVQVQVAGSSTPVLQADPMRYAIVVPNVAGCDLYLFTGSQFTTASGEIHVPDGGGPVVLTEDVIGELVRRDWSAFDGHSNTVNLAFLTVSYCSYRYEQMRRYVHARLSQFISL